MCSIQFECCPSTTVTLDPIKNSLIILSLYLSTVFQSFRAGEKGYYVTVAASGILFNFDMQHDHVLKKLNFDLLTPYPGSGRGGRHLGQIFTALLLHFLIPFKLIFNVTML